MKNIWFTADTHFGHLNVIKFSNRPCENNLLEMNNLIIDNWNAVVGTNDEVWHLGDIAFKDIEIYLPRLHGRINVIMGNHDYKKGIKNRIKPNITGEIYDLKSIKIGKKDITLCHYPIEQWNKKHYGAWHLHGHCHGTLKTMMPGRMDVGIDTHPEFRPYHFDEIEEKLLCV